MNCPLEEICDYQKYDHCEESKRIIKEYFCEGGGFTVCKHYRKFIRDNTIEDEWYLYNIQGGTN